MSSDTPRTDAAKKWWADWHGVYGVDPNFARQLERDLAAARVALTASDTERHNVLVRQIAELESSNQQMAESLAAARAEIAAKDAEIARRKGDAVTRLHNLCAALEQDRESSPFSKEAWDELEAENKELRARAERAEAEVERLRALCDAQRRGMAKQARRIGNDFMTLTELRGELRAAHGTLLLTRRLLDNLRETCRVDAGMPEAAYNALLHNVDKVLVDRSVLDALARKHAAPESQPECPICHGKGATNAVCDGCASTRSWEQPEPQPGEVEG